MSSITEAIQDEIERVEYYRDEDAKELDLVHKRLKQAQEEFDTWSDKVQTRSMYIGRLHRALNVLNEADG